MYEKLTIEIDEKGNVVGFKAYQTDGYIDIFDDMDFKGEKKIEMQIK